jgi:hypothetical protein
MRAWLLPPKVRFEVRFVAIGYEKYPDIIIDRASEGANYA